MAEQVVYLIDGKRYPQYEWMTMALADMVEIRKQTDLSANRAMSLLTDLDGMSMDDLADSPDHLTAFGVLLWLSRRAVEPDITFAQAIDFPFWELQIESPEPEVAPDPTE